MVLCIGQITICLSVYLWAVDYLDHHVPFLDAVQHLYNADPILEASAIDHADCTAPALHHELLCIIPGTRSGIHRLRNMQPLRWGSDLSDLSDLSEL